MKFHYVALAIASSISIAAFSQTPAAPNCMEGMQMPGCPAPVKPAAKQKQPASPSNCMEGMAMPGCPVPAKSKKSSPNMKPGMDMKQDQHQKMDMAPGTTMKNMQGMHSDMPDTQTAGQESITHSTQTLQEPETPTQRTGTLNSSVPDLLKEIAKRPPMSLDAFLSMADKGNPTLAQANAIVRRSEQQARQAGLYPNPSVGYQGEQIRGGSYGGGEQGGYVQQTIVLGGKLGLRRNIYDQQKASDQIGVQEQTYRIHNDVTQAFYTALTAQSIVVIRQRLLGVALDAVETVHQLANVGQADAPDVLQAEVEAEQAKVDYATSQRRYIESFRVLAANAGKTNLAVTPLEGALETPPQINADEQVAAIIAESPTVKRMQQEVAIAEARLRDSRRESVPDITLRAGEQYNNERVSENQPKPVGPQSFASAGITIPLWNRNQGNTEAAKAELERSKQDVMRTQLFLKQQAEPLAQAYLSSQFEAERYKTELIPRAQRAYDLYLQKYQSMASAYPQVIVSQRTLFQLQVGYLQALHDVWSNAVALQNFTLNGALMSPMSSGSSSTSINLPNASGGSPE